MHEWDKMFVPIRSTLITCMKVNSSRRKTYERKFVPHTGEG